MKLIKIEGGCVVRKRTAKYVNEVNKNKNEMEKGVILKYIHI